MAFVRLLITVLLINTFTFNAWTCSSFQLEGANPYHGKSYDWRFGDGYVVYNPSGLEKFSLSLNSTDKKIAWTSQYSSITYNQYGLDFPNGGINDNGLTVEVLWLDTSIFPPKDDKPVFNELQWIQYILDTQRTLKGALKTLDFVGISPIYAKVHYFVCDKDQNCATVEFVNGKKVIGTYEKYGYDVITNNTHKDSTKYLGLFKNFGGTQDVTWGTYHSLERFVRVNELLRVYDQSEPLSYSFKILDSVKRGKFDGSYTQWQIVHDKNNLITHFKTTFGNQSLGTVDLKQFPVECSNRYYFDFDNPTRGDVTAAFKPLTLEANYSLVKKTLRKVMPTAPEEMIQAISGAPYKFKCVQ